MHAALSRLFVAFHLLPLLASMASEGEFKRWLGRMLTSAMSAVWRDLFITTNVDSVNLESNIQMYYKRAATQNIVGSFFQMVSIISFHSFI
jgi:hypothetical protein